MVINSIYIAIKNICLTGEGGDVIFAIELKEKIDFINILN